MRRNIDSGRLTEHYRQMCRIRAFEQAAIAALDEKLVLGAIHPSIGQEAVASGICGNLERSDLILSTHRGHGHTMAKGAEPLAMMRELFGRAGGNCGGKGGSMHIADFEVGMLGANGVVGANISIAVGAAHSLKLQRRDGIVVCFFGDGAVNRGPFLEALNWAGVNALRVLFVCEDNGFAATTRTRTMTAGDGAAARAEALGIPAVTIDGNDLVEVDARGRELIGLVRGGGGPRMLVAETYRLTGHTAVDPATYRPAAEVEERWKRDPIARLRAVLQEAGVGTDLLSRIEAEAKDEMDEAYREAAASPWPDVSGAFTDVQDVGDPRERAF